MSTVVRLGAVLLLFVIAAGAGVLDSHAQKMPSKEMKENPVAPEVIVFSPAEERTVVNTPEIEVGVVAYSLLQNAGVEVRFTLVNAAGRSDKVLPTRPKEEMVFRLTLAEGENVLTFVARNERAESKPLTKVVIYTPRTAKQDDLLYLGIGVSDYAQLPKLSFAARDAEELSRLLLKQEAGKVFDNVDAKIILNTDATRENIIKGLSWVVDKADERDDVALVFYSGQIGRDKLGDFYLLAPGHGRSDDMEISGVSVATVMRILSRSGGRVVLFVDGGTASGDTGFGSLKRYVEGAGNITLCLASEDASLESPELQHGVFAGALLEALSGKADTNNDTYVDSGELQFWLQRRVQTLTNGRQHPVCVRPANFEPFRVVHNQKP